MLEVKREGNTAYLVITLDLKASEDALEALPSQLKDFATSIHLDGNKLTLTYKILPSTNTSDVINKFKSALQVISNTIASIDDAYRKAQSLSRKLKRIASQYGFEV